jgi:type VI secretion system protein ImpF
MAEELVRQSVFDRLTGADRVEELVFPEPAPEPTSRTGRKPVKPPRPIVHRRLPRTVDESIEVLKRNVLRDIEQLLNARQISDPATSPHDFLERSAYNFGLRDLSSFSADSAETPAALLSMIENSIAVFEPRLMNARVKLVSAGSAQSRSVRFLISGTLRTDPDPERVAFDTVLEIATKRFEVSSREPDAG